ncbi:MAG TPA: alpha-D-ribose 1-methylphosphonate 5-triphosphate diphosphatase [bacterium]|nr:alpha-D-ribose 1-methylphosphonate 5-triphosphate diphosphatase [bacterium]
MNRFQICGGIVVGPEEVRERACIAVERGRIAAITEEPQNAWGIRVDVAGCYVLPGLIDLHCDAIERELEPRTGVLFPASVALRSLEGRLVASGITTAYHSISFAEEEFGVRSRALAGEIVEATHRRAEISPIRLRVHLRYEVTHQSALPAVLQLVERGRVHLLSFMDHTPGQGQYREAEEYRRFLADAYGTRPEEFSRLMVLKHRGRRDAAAGLARLAAAGRARGVPLSSHDDDSAASIEAALARGATISEFPVTLEAACHAAACGMAVCVGAPNVVRGGSQGAGIRALDAIEIGAASVLCSDYYPAALLSAVFQLGAGRLPLPAAVRLATLNPAQAAGLAHHTGSLEPGKWADLIVVRLVEGTPEVMGVMRAGQWAYRPRYAVAAEVEDRLDVVESGPVASLARPGEG